jgi:four helix bundle protein
MIIDAKYLMLVAGCLIKGLMIKNEFIHFLTYAIASNDETIDHLETLFEIQSLNDKELYNSLHEQLEILGKKLNLFIKSVTKGHISEK